MTPHPEHTVQNHDNDTAFALIMQCRAELSRILGLPDYVGIQFSNLIQSISQRIISANTRAPDLMMACILLKQEGDYGVRQAINVAIIVDQLLNAIEYSVIARLPVLNAALTMNISMHALQETLNKQATPLSNEQRIAMQRHPLSGRETLRTLGISDPLWLDCVTQHHERYDGSGYPHQLKADAICFEARLIGLADRYSALLNHAAWRTEQLADSALFTTLHQLSGTPDERLGKLFIQELGIYPAGTLVQLSNGEIGVVHRQGANEECPIVCCLFDALLDPVSPPSFRDTQIEGTPISSILNHRKLAAPIDLIAIWGDEAR